MDVGNNEVAGGAPETGPQLLTKEIVQNRINYGHYYVAHDTTSKSEAYKYIQKVYESNTGEAILYWFYCPYCRDLFYQNVSVGTTPLLRHLRIACKSVPANIREELIATQKVNPPLKKSSEQPQKLVKLSKNHIVLPTIDSMADALCKATEIGVIFGQAIDVETYKRLLLNPSTW